MLSRMVCAACGWENPAGSRFCNQCGRPTPLAGRAPDGPPGRSGTARPGEPALARPLPRALVSLPAWGCPVARVRTAGPAALLLAAAGLVLGVGLLWLGPDLWTTGLPALRAQLKQMPLAIAVVGAAVVVAGLVAASARQALQGAGASATQDAPPHRARALARRVAAHAWRPGAPLLALALAIVGQGLLFAAHSAAGVLCYLAALGLAWWAARAPAPGAWSGAGAFLTRYEWPLALAALAVGAGLRLVLLGTYPYGIEGDESKWSWSVVQFSMAGETHSWPATLFNDYAPFSLVYIPLFFTLFGPSIFTARALVAGASIVAAGLFYLLVRRALGVPAALLATFLLSVSIADVSASRLGHVEPHVKFWVVLAAFFAVWAVDVLLGPRALPASAHPAVPNRAPTTGRPPAWAAPVLCFLCGVTLVAGLLTYPTFNPMAAAVGLYLGGAVLLALRRHPAAWRVPVASAGLFLLPVVLATPRVLAAMAVRRNEYQVVLALWGPGPSPEGGQRLLSYLGTNLHDLLTSLFVRQRFGDFLLNRDGPFVNALLLPFFVLGVAWALVHLRTRHVAFVLLWFGLLFFFAPVLMGAVWFRVVHPAFPALYVLAALGLWWCYRALAALAGRPGHRALGAGLCGFLGVLTVLNTYIYFHEVVDFEDRVHRRELADLIHASVGPGRLVYLAYQPNRGDFIDLEGPFNRFVVRGRVGIGREHDYYRQLPYTDLLPSIFQERERYGELRVIAEGPQAPLGTLRWQVLGALVRCFPGTTARTGQHVMLYTIPASALAAPACTVTASAQLVEPSPGARLPAAQPVALAWQVDQGSPSEFRVQVERRNERVLAIDAESFTGPHWSPETRYVDGFRGAGFLQDDYQAGPATQQVEIPAEGTYAIWVRSLRRVADNTHVYLDVGTGPRELARPGATPLNQWVWESLGSEALPAGPRELTITKEYGTTYHVAIFIDEVVLSADPTFDPSQQDFWDPVLDRSRAATGATIHREALPALPPGRYRWRVQLLDGQRLIDDNGQTGRWTAYSEFHVE